MRIYNPFKNEVYASDFNAYSLSNSYTPALIEDDYDIFLNERFHNSLFCVFIKDEEERKRIFDIVCKLKEYGKIDLASCNITIKKIVLNRKEKILFAFYVSIESNIDRENVNPICFLNEFIRFANKLCEFNISLNEKLISKANYSTDEWLLLKSIFYFEKKDGLSSDEIKSENDKILIDIIFKCHYEEESMFDDFEKSEAYELENFKYSLTIFKLFYDYYKNNKIDKDILKVFEDELDLICNNKNDRCIKRDGISFDFCKAYVQLDCCSKICKALIVPNYNHLSVCEKNEEYVKYMGKSLAYKIFENSSDMFYIVKNILTDNRFEDSLNISFKGLLFDINGTFIGYRYDDNYNKFKCTPLLLNQIEFTDETSGYVIKFFWELFTFVNKFRVEEKSDVEEINIKEDICFYPTSKNADTYHFYFKDEYSYYKALYSSSSKIKNEIVFFFLETYSKYIKNNYKDVTKDSIYDILEFILLPPLVARELFHYMFFEDKSIDVDWIYYEFFADFMKDNKFNSLKNIFYYSKYGNNFLNIEFIFEDDLKEKLNLDEPNTNTNIVLNDDKCAYIFKRVREFGPFNGTIEKNKEYLNKLNILSDKIHILRVKTIILSKKISSSGMYFVKGYVTDRHEGKPLNEILTSGITNKDFIKISLEFFSRFGENSMSFDSLSNVTMDDNYNFYISIVNPFEFRTHYNAKEDVFITEILSHLSRKGIEIPGIDIEYICNQTKFLDFSEFLEDEYDRLRVFCKEHNIWHEKGKMCPICEKTLFDIEPYINDNSISSRNLIYEDKYAKYYSIWYNRVCIKVYKEDVIDLKRQEKIIDTMVKHYNEDKNFYLQEYFVPVKKAVIFSTKTFVGYVYDYVNFDEFKDLVEFPSLLKIKSFVLLYKQVQSLQKKNIFFARSPYDKLLFTSKKKNQIQILNIDLISSENSELKEDLSHESEKYLKDYITAQVALNKAELKGLDTNTSSVENLIINLKEFAGGMVKQCMVHGIHYHKDFVFCPLCHPNFDMSTFNDNMITLNVKRLQETSKEIGKGGEAIVYEYEQDTLAKIFKEDVNIDLKVNIILKIIERRDILEKFNKQNSKFVFVIPEKIIKDSNTNSIVGYTLKKVNGKSVVTLRDKEKVEELNLSKKDVLEILIAFGEGIEYLHHNANIFIGDLNNNNIMFDTDKTVYFIDFDGMGVDDIYPQVFTPGYVDPIAEQNYTITKEHDWYSFAIQAFYYFTYTHPFNGVYYSYDLGRNLNRVERMERHLSLLGDHDIKLPKVAVSFEWMKKCGLYKVFLGIFENDTRENITPYLKKYYKKKYLVDFQSSASYSDFSETKTTKKGTVSVEKISLFNTDDCKKIINSFSYILNSNKLNIVLSTGTFTYPYGRLEYETIYNVILSNDERFIYVVYSKIVEVYDRVSETSTVFDKFENSKVVVNDNVLYYFNLNNNLIKAEFFEASDYVEKKIKIKENFDNTSFSVVENKKFVFLSRKDSVDSIYCNDILFHEATNIYDLQHNVLYDDKLKKWLIVNSAGQCVIIHSDGGKTCFTDEKILETVLSNVIFEYGNIYVPLNGAIYIRNTKKNTTKLISCDIVTKDSKIIIRKRAFVIINENQAYEYKKA